MRMTFDLLDAFARCPQKAFLRCTGEEGRITEYEAITQEATVAYQQECVQRLCAQYAASEILSTPPSLDNIARRRHRLILNASSVTDLHTIVFPVIERVTTSKTSPKRHYANLAFSCRRKLTKHDKLVAAALGTALSDWHSLPVTCTKIIHGPEYSTTRVGLLKSTGRPTRIGADARALIESLHEMLQHPSEPGVFLNNHCDICEYQDRCLQHAHERDDLTLLRGLHRKEIEAWNERGIFTVTQLAYTFRPKALGRSSHQPKRHSLPLQAMAIRDGTTYVRKLPELPAPTAKVYFDVEGMPDSGLFYLIGAVIVQGGDPARYQFWANGEAEEAVIWHNFLHALAPLDEYVLIHFGRYEKEFVQEMQRRYGDECDENPSDLLSRMFDLHAALRTNVFFPVYANRLKEIASYLGFRWQGPVRSGIASIVWRTKWEMTGAPTLKGDLLRYNHEDCLAVMTLFDHLVALSLPSESNGTQFSATDDLPDRTDHTFGKSAFALPALRAITKSSYFNYQHDKVFFRTDKHVRRSTQRKRRASKRQLRPNTVVVCVAPDECPRCGQSKMVRTHSGHDKAAGRKNVRDLKFSPAGVKRWVVRYETDRYCCQSCRYTCYSPEYPTKGRKYGCNVASWAVYQHIALRQSFEAVTESTNDVFGYSFSGGMVKTAHTQLAEVHVATEETLLSRIRSGEMACVDETKFKIKGCTGYVWAVSGPEAVIYRFSESREGAIVNDVLDGFAGVLVSDFYGAYDSMPFVQQKCLVHLTRDINDDLLKAPFDEELKDLANRFTALMTPIIEVIDRYGLKKRYLRRFVRSANGLRNWMAKQQFESSAAQRYQKRFDRYGDRLFTFLSHDGVPWNNNNAENAVKLVVSRRRLIGGLVSKNGIRDYLIFLSIYQTLRRKNGSFLRFLLSGETDVFRFLGE